MKFTTTIFIVLTTLTAYHAQEYKFFPASNNLKFENINSLTIEGHSGKEVMIYLDNDSDTDYEGLPNLSEKVLKNNNKLGILVENTNTIVLLSQINCTGLCSNDDKEYTVKVPHASNLNIQHSAWDGDDLSINNITGELEISTNFNDIYLKNVTGPMSVKTVYGSIEAEIRTVSQVGAITLYSVYEHVDITVPENTETNVNLQTNLGNIYSDLNLSIDPIKSGKKGRTGSKVIGTANGGGVDIIATSLRENIYIRSY